MKGRPARGRLMLAGSMSGRLSLLGTLITIALTGCGDGTSIGPDGVPEWSVGVRPYIEIGEYDGDPNYLFQRIVAVSLLPDGGVVVADRGSATVRVFDADGVFRAEFGGLGEGPGEFSYINAMSLRQPDTVVVYDSGQYRLSVFLVDGTLESTVTVRADTGFPEAFLGRFSNGDLGLGWIVQDNMRDAGSITPDIMDFGRFSSSGNFIERIGRGTGMLRFGRGPLPLSPFLHAFLHRDSVFVTDGMTGMAVLDEGGATARTFGPTYAPMAVDAAYDALMTKLETVDRPDFLLRIMSEQPRPDSIPRFAEVLLDDQGRFWMKEYVPDSDSQVLGGFQSATGGHWWIVDPDDGVVATIDLPDNLILRDIRSDMIAGVTRDEFGVERVVAYTIR
jgi:hypothetical protein